MNETYIDIPGYEGRYQVSNLGNVKSIRKNLILSPGKGAKGYFHIGLCKGGKQNNTTIHRLVAELFVANPNPEILTWVDHKNGDRTDNRAENLRWVTPRQNHYNRVEHRNNEVTSSYIGVCWCKLSNRWECKIRIDGKQKRVGRFKTELEAAQAYDNALSALGLSPVNLVSLLAV